MNYLHAYSVLKSATKDSKTTVRRYMFKRLFGQRGKFDKEVFIETENCIFSCSNLPCYALTVCPYFEANTMKEILNLKKGTFVDIGANIGKFAIAVAKNNPNVKVIAIECYSPNFDLLIKNIKINGVGNTVIAYGLAVSDKDGEEKMYIDSLHPTTNSLIHIDNPDCSTIIPCNRLDTLLSNIENIRLIKIDIEGAELKALRGAIKILKKHKPDIIFESGTSEKYREVRRFLESKGYTFFKDLGDFNTLAELGK